MSSTSTPTSSSSASSSSHLTEFKSATTKRSSIKNVTTTTQQQPPSSSSSSSSSQNRRLLQRKRHLKTCLVLLTSVVAAFVIILFSVENVIIQIESDLAKTPLTKWMFDVKNRTLSSLLSRRGRVDGGGGGGGVSAATTASAVAPSEERNRDNDDGGGGGGNDMAAIESLKARGGNEKNLQQQQQQQRHIPALGEKKDGIGDGDDGGEGDEEGGSLFYGDYASSIDPKIRRLGRLCDYSIGDDESEDEDKDDDDYFDEDAGYAEERRNCRNALEEYDNDDDGNNVDDDLDGYNNDGNNEEDESFSRKEPSNNKNNYDNCRDLEIVETSLEAEQKETKQKQRQHKSNMAGVSSGVRVGTILEITSGSEGRRSSSSYPNKNCVVLPHSDNIDDDDDTGNTGIVHYELMERVQNELGLIDVHSVDYAYRPPHWQKEGGERKKYYRDYTGHGGANGESDSMPSSGSSSSGAVTTVVENQRSSWFDGWLRTPIERTLTFVIRPNWRYRRNGSYDDEKSLTTEEGRSSLFWGKRTSDGGNTFWGSGLFYFFGNRNDEKSSDSPGNDEGEERYETMGEQAFAGGSHGEVWKARRRCPLHSQRSLEDDCDEKQELIMKRLKLEHGFDILEAGLREIYFGKLLAQELSSNKLLFTRYIDHFFLDGGKFYDGKLGNGTTDLELWIVFSNAGPSLRSYLYTPVNTGDFILYQNSDFWRRLRRSVARGQSRDATTGDVALVPQAASKLAPFDCCPLQNGTKNDETHNQNESSSSSNESALDGSVLLQTVLRQLLTAAAFLHERGIVHRDIKPSNIMCRMSNKTSIVATSTNSSLSVSCVLGDFSSAWDNFTNGKLYRNGPSASEQTDEYAPPEALLFRGGSSSSPDQSSRDDGSSPSLPASSYDSWSIGVVALEMLLGTPNVFSVDQRTRVILSRKLEKEGASPDDIRRALYLAALSQFCIYHPQREQQWQRQRNADDSYVMFDAPVARPTCTLQDFNYALRARDPLGLGFDSPSSDSLLQLIWELLAWDPEKRITPRHALSHIYFTHNHNTTSGTDTNSNNDGSHALETRKEKPALPISGRGHHHYPPPTEFHCPKCGKTTHNWESCQRHARGRKHALFCHYNRSTLPPCLNAHPMLPTHPNSGYCDIQGRRPSIEDFHALHLKDDYEFYGVFDGHWGNLASKYAASRFHDLFLEKLTEVPELVLEQDEEKSTTDDIWKRTVTKQTKASMVELHERFRSVALSSPGRVMEKSGTTATVLYLTNTTFLVANVGDSRAILSRGRDAPPLQLTVDHVASNATEAELVRNRGGSVTRTHSKGGIDRVHGTLAVTRSVGDVPLEHYLSREAHVVVMTRDEVRRECSSVSARVGTDQDGDEAEADFPCFVVLASDGLWDVLHNREAVDMVLEVLNEYSSTPNDNDNDDSPPGGDMSVTVRWEEGGAFQEAAQRLTQEAYVRGSTDNIGVCVVAIV